MSLLIQSQMEEVTLIQKTDGFSQGKYNEIKIVKKDKESESDKVSFGE